MVGFCLPKKQADILRDALADKRLDVWELRKMSSADRKAAFSKVLGKENAEQVNVLYEEKLLLKDQRRGMDNWKNQLLGLNQETRKALEDQINSHRRVLDPANERTFKASLAAKVTGAEVTMAETKEIVGLADKARAAREAVRQNDTPETRLELGYSRNELLDRVRELKEDKLDVNRLKNLRLNKADMKFLVKEAYGLGLNILNIPRGLKAGYDFSATRIQGKPMTHTPEYWAAFKRQHEYYASEENWQRLRAEIAGREDIETVKASGLRLTDLDSGMALREEQIQSDLMEKLQQKFADFANENISKPLTGKNLVPNPSRAANRAYAGFLNDLRINAWDSLISVARARGEDLRPGSEVTKDIAATINNLTNSGALGKNDSAAFISPWLNAIFFSPRKNVAQFNRYLNPTTYIKSSPTARNAAWKGVLADLAVTGTMLGLATAAGYQVDWDPSSQRFLLAKFGKTDIDSTAGDRTLARLIAQLVTGEIHYSNGRVEKLNEGYKPKTRGDLMLRYIRSKLAPVTGSLTDAVVGTDFQGQPVTVEGEAVNLTKNMYLGGVYDLWHSGEEGVEALILTVTSLYGVGIQPAQSQNVKGLGVTPWGGDADAPPDPDEETLNEALMNADFFEKGNSLIPPKNINGVKLKDAQYHDYIRINGLYAKQALLPVIQSEAWAKNSPEIQLSYIKDRLSFWKTQASMAVMTDDLKKNQEKGTPQDSIFYKSQLLHKGK